jgi:WhiB family redox-sensing transcriptional regulator
MAPMQWPDASMSATSATGIEAMPADFDTITMVPVQGGYALPVPSGQDLPCTEDPELFFAEAPADVEAAKALCQGCRARGECLAGALERREPWGVWGGELILRGTIVPRKRPRGRPRKNDPAVAGAGVASAVADAAEAGKPAGEQAA